MESLSQIPILPPHTTTQTYTLPCHTQTTQQPFTQPGYTYPTTQALTMPGAPSHVIYHGQPHLQQQFEQQQQQQEQYQQQQQQMVLQQHQYFQYPQPQSGAQAFAYPTQPLTAEEQYYLHQQQQQFAYQPHPSEPTTPLTPSYASLDPSTLYALHSTMFSDGSRSTSSYSG